MVFDPWRRCRRAVYRTRDAASTNAGDRRSIVVSCRTPTCRTIYVDPRRKLDTSSISGRRTTDRNSPRRPVPRGLHLAQSSAYNYPSALLSSRPSSRFRLLGFFQSENRRRNKQNTRTPRLNNRIKNNFPSGVSERKEKKGKKKGEKERGETSISRDYGISQTDTVDATSRKTAD